MNNKCIFIAGGGTGGHIYPGVAIARAVLKDHPDAEVHFIGTAEGLEVKILPREGFALHLIHGGKLNFAGGFVKKIKTLFGVTLGFLESLRLLKKYQPAFVMGVGGYASAPMVLASAFMKYQTAIWEPNALPGLANRWLSRFVKTSYVVFEEAKTHLSSPEIKVVGMPVRSELERSSKNVEESLSTNSKIRILHFGGSQGSRAIGTALCDAITSDPNWAKKYYFIHQTGSLDYEKLKIRYQGFEENVEVHEFIFDMPQVYLKSDLVICRGGASTLNEISAFGLPAIVVPLPAADAHQEKNARALAQLGGVSVLIQSELTPESLKREIDLLAKDITKLRQMGQANRAFYKPKAAEKLAQEIWGKAFDQPAQ